MDFDFHTIPSRFTDPIGPMRSLGTEIIWGSETLWRYEPEAAKPEALFTAEPDEYISIVNGGAAGYVFVTNKRIGGYDAPNRWRMWYLDRNGGEPVLLDANDHDTLPSPYFAIDDRRIVWTAFHGLAEDARSELHLVEIDDLEHPTTLLSSPAIDLSVWLPVLHGDELWYGVNRNDWNAGAVHPHIEMIDLGNVAARPRCTARTPARSCQP